MKSLRWMDSWFHSKNTISNMNMLCFKKNMKNASPLVRRVAPTQIT